MTRERFGPVNQGEMSRRPKRRMVILATTRFVLWSQAARSKTLASFFGRGGAIFFVVRRSRIATNTLPPRFSNLVPPRSKSRGSQFLNGLLDLTGIASAS